MGGERVLLVAADRRAKERTAAFLSGLGLRVEARSSLPAAREVPAPPANPLMAVVLLLEDGRERLPSALADWRRSRPATPVIAVGRASCAPFLTEALEAGLVDHVADPANPATLHSALRSERRRAEAVRGQAAAREELGRLKKELARRLRIGRQTEEAYDTTLENFMAALDLRDVETFGHSKTVARYSYVLAQAAGIRDPEALDNIRKGALLHDAGKMAIPDAILKKPGPLTPAEWSVIKRHPALGFGLVRDLKLVREIGDIILCHHERYDGTGYPKGLKGERIPLEARVFAVADALDAVTSYRPYRAPRPFSAAREEIAAEAGRHFDPRIVEAFLAQDLTVWEKIRFETTRLLPPLEDHASLVPRR